MPSKKSNCYRFNKTYKKWINKKKMGGCGCQQGQGSSASLPDTLFSGGRRRSSRRRRRSIKGGIALGQGSSASLPDTLFSGGRRRSSRRRRRSIKGGIALGQASLTDFDPGFKYTYPVNDHMNDPLAPTNILDVRMQQNMIGGRRKRRKTRSRKLRGGSNDPFINAYESNTLSSPPLTSLAGATNAVNIITGQDNPSMTYSDNIITGRPFI